MSTEPKLPLGDILDVLRERVTDPEVLKTITADLMAASRELAAEKAAEKENASGSKNKYRLTVLIRGDASLKALVAGGAYVFAVPDDPELVETYSGEGLLQRFYKAVHAHNYAPQKGVRGRKRSLFKTFGDAVRGLKPKAIKSTESAFKIKTALPVEVIVVEKEEV